MELVIYSFFAQRLYCGLLELFGELANMFLCLAHKC